MKKEVSLLSLLSQISSNVEEDIELLQQNVITSDRIIKTLDDQLLDATIKAIQSYSNDSKVTTEEYGNFYISLIERLIGDKDRASFILDTQTRYTLAENSVAYAYIFAAYLIRVDSLADAKSILSRTIRDNLEDHYVSRTVFTLKSRANVKNKHIGWCIGIAEHIFKSNKSLQSVFFHNREQFIDLVCQVDFLQYYLEFEKTQDVYHGYPNFLYYDKKRTTPLIKKLEALDKDKIQVNELVDALSSMNTGEFFMMNRWKYE